MQKAKEKKKNRVVLCHEPRPFFFFKYFISFLSRRVAAEDEYNYVSHMKMTATIPNNLLVWQGITCHMQIKSHLINTIFFGINIKMIHLKIIAV